MSASRPMPHLPYGFARSQGVMVGSDESGLLRLLVRDDASPMAIAEARRCLSQDARFVIVSKSAFERELNERYSSQAGLAADVLADVGPDVDLGQLLQEVPQVEDLLEAQDDAPVIRMINALLMQAARERASDVHIEPFADRSLVRVRRDGMLRDIAEPPRALHEAMVSRIKIMGALDIAEKRLPQDGRIGFRLGSRAIDVRVSTLPTAHGERVVMRVLEKNAAQLNLDALGMDATTLARLRQMIDRPHGLVLVTGPTGSGKTTTLYAALSGMDIRQQNIVTVEDPVEYDLVGIGQVQVNPRIGLTFAKALRSLLRQDPDVIMIGEIRDLETAEIAIQASLTGHLVLATLHTNDAVAAVTRLVDMGVERYLLASSLVGVLAQRLVRRLCPSCSTVIDGSSARVWHASGCPSCLQTGYSGRLGIYELVPMTPALAELIHQGAPESDMRQQARKQGARSLLEDAQRYVESGLTSREEVIRVASDEVMVGDLASPPIGITGTS